MLGEIFARAHFYLIPKQQTSPRAEGDMEIFLIGSFASFFLIFQFLYFGGPYD